MTWKHSGALNILLRYSLIVLLLWVSSDPAAGQETQWLSIRSISGWAGFEFMQEYEKNETEPGVYYEERTGSYLYETLNLRLLGSVYHPRFLSWSLNGAAGLTQSYFDFYRDYAEDEETEETESNNFIGDYEFEGTFFKDHAFSFGFFSIYHDAVINRRLRERFEIEDRARGIIYRLLLPVFRSRGKYTVRNSTGRRFSENVDERNEFFSVYGEGDIGARWDLQGNYDLNKYSERKSELERTTQFAHFTVNTQLSEDASDSSIFFLHFHKQEGFVKARTITADERLSYKINDMFSIRPAMSLTDEEYENFEGFRQSYQVECAFQPVPEGGFRVIPEYIREDFTSAEREERAIELGGWYRKRVGRHIISASENYQFRRTSIRSETGYAAVINERHAFDEDDRVELQKSNILAETIVVKNAAGTFFYEEGRDYVVRVFGGVTALIRSAGGLIPRFGEILTDYRYEVPGIMDYEMHYNGTRAELSLFETASMYYMFSTARPDIIKTTNQAFLERFTRHTLGIEFMHSSASLRAEYHDKDSNIHPLHGYIFSVKASSPEFRGITASGEAGYQSFQYPADDDFNDLKYAHLRSSWGISDRMRLSGVIYGREDNSRFAETKAWDMEIIAEWRLRSLTLEGIILYRIIRENEVRSIERISQVSIRRSF